MLTQGPREDVKQDFTAGVVEITPSPNQAFVVKRISAAHHIELRRVAGKTQEVRLQ